MMKNAVLMGIDFGERRIGIALSDAEQRIAIGHSTLDSRIEKDPILKLLAISKEFDVRGIVIGYPIRTDTGLPGEKAFVIDKFIEELQAIVNLPVYREDEAFSSTLAQQRISQRGKKSFKKKSRGAMKNEIDRIAACIILQDYLDQHREYQ